MKTFRDGWGAWKIQSKILAVLAKAAPGTCRRANGKRRVSCDADRTGKDRLLKRGACQGAAGRWSMPKSTQNACVQHRVGRVEVGRFKTRRVTSCAPPSMVLDVRKFRCQTKLGAVSVEGRDVRASRVIHPVAKGLDLRI